MKISRKKLIIWLILDLATAAALFLLGTYIQAGGARLEALSSEIDMLNQREREVATLELAARETADDRARLNSFFVDSRDVTGFLKSLESMGAAAGTTAEISSIKISSAEPSTLEVKLKANGPFTGLYRLIEFLESAPHEIKMHEFNLSQSGGAGGGWSGDFNLELLSFTNSSRE